MKFEIENSVIASYKRLSYDAWYAFAEFVDNSTQAYFDNREVLDRVFNNNGEKLTIEIIYDKNEDIIKIKDNSIGMDDDDLNRAFKVGQPPLNPTGRSKYGLGMKTAACWFGDNWKVRTKKLGKEKEYEVEIDVSAISKQEGEVNLNVTSSDSPKENHFTEIIITDLNRKLMGRTLGKIKDYLSSIYRIDIQSGIEIKWNGTKLFWKGYEDELYIDEKGVKAKKIFEFEINNKVVKGWAGVLGKGHGSRQKAGFSIIQSNRIIQVGFKPSTLFGEQEDGTNDLVNQRLIGELELDDFSVSHTKDKIVWESDEEELLDKKLGEYCEDMKQIAQTIRFSSKADTSNLIKYRNSTINILLKELKTNKLINYIKKVEPFPESIIKESYEKSIQTIKEDDTPSMVVNIGDEVEFVEVSIYFSEKTEVDPYILFKTTVLDNKLIVIVNMLHPYVCEISSSDILLNFVRQSVYEGVAEWKALKLRNTIQPNTIKFIKDGLLRLPFEISKNGS